MRSINALSLTSNVNDWLTDTRRPRILHIFDRACNLINERGEVLSIVMPRIGNGPFNIVVEVDVCFSERLSLEAQVSNSPSQLTLGGITIHTTGAELWSPRPDWERLHAQRDNILDELSKLPITNYQFSDFPISSLSAALAGADVSSALRITSRLAGLGKGLTPSGDDFIMGALYASWILQPLEKARVIAEEIADIAAPLTTSLSAAWLRSAGRGEAGILWHEFFKVLLAEEKPAFPLRIAQLLSVGETSGADALSGFIGVFAAFRERMLEECPS